MDLTYGILLCVVFVGWCEGFVKSKTYIKNPAFNDQMCPAEQVEFQKGTRSAIDCVRACDKMQGCTSIVFLHDNKTCFGLKSGQPFNASTPLPGAVFYTPRSYATSTTVDTSTTSSTTPMTPSTADASTAATTATPTSPETTTTAPTSSTTQATTTYGPGTPLTAGLPNSQFSASTVWTANWEAWQARLSNTATTWSPDEFLQDTNQWIQVEFLSDILAMHVITKGRPNDDRWVSSYRVLTSSDCSNFVAVKDGGGSDKVFPGNSDRNTAVQNALEPPVTCRCFRINPLTWVAYIQLRFELLGHII